MLYGVTDADDGVSGVEIEVSVDDGGANDAAGEDVAQAVRELLNPAVEESQAAGTTGTGRRIIQGTRVSTKILYPRLTNDRSIT